MSVTYFAERYSWQKQELGKGCLPSANPLGKTSWAGWGFEKNWKGMKRKRPVPEEGEEITQQEIAQYPAFRLKPEWMNSRYLSRRRINSLLAMGIPTLTPAVGNQALGGQESCKNLQSTEFRPNGWPNRGRDWQTRWLHGDMKDVAYYFNFKLYKHIIENGGL